MKISLIIPTYNEHDNIIDLISKIKSNLDEQNINFNIFIVDDSSDKKIFDLLKIYDGNINYIYRGKKLGRGSAVLEGIKFALDTDLTDIIIEMDADLSHDPKELISKINIFINNKCDLLIASRYTKKSKIIGWPLSRKILSYLANKIANLILKIPVSDYTNGYRFYSKESAKLILNKCGNIGDGFIVLSEILLQIHMNKLKICETDTYFKNRTRGISSVNLNLILNSIKGLIKLYFIKKKYKNN